MIFSKSFLTERLSLFLSVSEWVLLEASQRWPRLDCFPGFKASAEVSIQRDIYFRLFKEGPHCANISGSVFAASSLQLSLTGSTLLSTTPKKGNSTSTTVGWDMNPGPRTLTR